MDQNQQKQENQQKSDEAPAELTNPKITLSIPLNAVNFIIQVMSGLAISSGAHPLIEDIKAQANAQVIANSPPLAAQSVQ